ncbi:MAG: hypothetical protein ABJC13_02500 [Acidobacteriota bacterium]
MKAKAKKKLNLSQETISQLTNREILKAVGGATLKCTNSTEFCSDPSCNTTCSDIC